MSTAVDTSKVSDRRSLRFDSFADIRKDLDQLEVGQRAGTVRATGNWSPGQIFSHLAAFMNYPYDGYPPELANPPWFVKFIMKFMKNKYVHQKLPAGVRIPGIPAGTVGAEDVGFDVGLRAFRSGLDRMQRSAPAMPNVIFGPMTHEEWMQLQCRHAELHLGFLHPR